MLLSAEECGAALHTVTPGSVFGAYMGESERRLRSIFEAAAAEAESGRQVILFLDEIDALCPRRAAAGSGNQHEARVVAQLLTLLDGAASAPNSSSSSNDQGQPSRAGWLVVIAATNRPNALDPALRRPGRLDHEVAISVPDAAQRADILRSVYGCSLTAVCWLLGQGQVEQTSCRQGIKMSSADLIWNHTQQLVR